MAKDLYFLKNCDTATIAVTNEQTSINRPLKLHMLHMDPPIPNNNVSVTHDAAARRTNQDAVGEVEADQRRDPAGHQQSGAARHPTTNHHALDAVPVMLRWVEAAPQAFPGQVRNCMQN